MTVKSPFYNKPSTATSVDSCHKCPSTPSMQTTTTTLLMQDSTEPIPPLQGPSLDERSGQEPMAVDSGTSNSDDSCVAGPCSSSAATTENGSMPTATRCSNCGTTATPLWRRSPQGETICNACGLYLKARNTLRPPGLKRHSKSRPALFALAPAPRPILPLTRAALPSSAAMPPFLSVRAEPMTRDRTMSHSAKNNSSGHNKDSPSMAALVCFNCSATTTPLWRRDSEGNTICNACGLYFKLHNVHRPVSMKRSVIQRRKRVPAAVASRSPFYYHQPSPPSSSCSSSDDDEASISSGSPPNYPPMKRRILPQIQDKVNAPDAMEPDAFGHISLPSPPLYPCSSKLAALAGLPSTLPMLPSIAFPGGSRETPPPLETSTTSETSAASTTAAIAAVSALLNPTASPEKMQQMLETHRYELQREVSNLTTMLSRTTHMLQNLDKAMALQDVNPGKVNDALTLLSLASAKD